MANKTFNTRVKNKRDTAANWEAVATTFQPLDGELIIVDTAAGKTRFKVGRYDTAKGRLLYYNEIPFTDEYLYNDLNESQGKIYDKLKGIDDKPIIEMTLESVFDNTKFINYRIGLWQFPKTGFYKLNISKRGTTATQLMLYAQKTKEDGTTPEDPFSQDNLLRISPLTGDKQVESVFVQVDYTDTDTLTVYKVQFLNVMTFPGTININTYNKTTQKWDFTSVTESSAKWANNATKVSNAITLTKGDTTTKFDGSTAQAVEIPTKTSELTNDSFVSYTEQALTKDQQNQAKTNLGIDILTCNTTTVTPTQVKEAILAGRPIAITYVDNTYGNLTFTSFGYSLENNVVVANLVATSNGQYILADLTGIINTNGWTLQTTELGTSTDIANNYVKYSESQTLTDEQKAQARTNIGAISSSELVQSDWNQNDETAKDYVKNRPCYTAVTSETSREILQGSGTFTPLLGLVLGETYNINYSTQSGTAPSGEGTNYVCKDLHNTVSSAPVGTLYIGDINSDGSSNGYTIYDDHIELNSGFSYMVNPQRWKITGNLNPTTIVPLPEKYYPKETAKVYVVDSNGERIENSIIQVENSSSGLELSDKYKIKAVGSSLYAPPPDVSFYEGEVTIKLDNVSFDNLFGKTSEIPGGIHSYYTANQIANNLISSVCNNNSFGIINLVLSDETLKFLVTKGSVTNTYPGQYYKYATNPVIVDRYSYDSNTKERYFGLYTLSFIADSDGKFVSVNHKKWIDNTHLITTSDIDTALSSTSENPVQNKVIKAAIDDLQASIDEQEPLIGTTDTLTVDQVKAAVLAGRPVVVSYTDTTYGELKFTNFAYSTAQDVIVSNMIAGYSGIGYILAELVGTNQWSLMTTVIAEKADLDANIQDIYNQLGGLTGAMHFIGKAAVDITDGSTTDPQIVNYTTKEKGDVILGKDDHKEFVWNGAIWEELGDEGSYALKTTTINGKALSYNITLTASDVGAASASAIETMQAAIDSKPSAADAVYTATAASTDGVAYTATVSGIDSLTVGASFIMIPNKASTSKAPTLNVNGLGAKPIRRRLSSLTTSLQQGYSTNWIALNKPFTVVYDGTAWVIEGLTKTDGADVYGAVAQATADAKGNNIADTYATIAMLQSLLPKVTTITLTSNWVGDASPYYQDIALSCVTETSIVDLQPTPEQLNSWQDDGLAFTTLSGNGTVRVYVAGGKPSSAISVQVRVQEVTVI